MIELHAVHRRLRGTPLHASSGAVLAIALAAGVALGGISARAGQEPAAAPRPPDVIPLARLIPDARVALALAPGAVATEDGLWVPTASGITRIDAVSNVAGPAVALPAAPCASLVVAFGSVWAPLCAPGTVARVDAKTQAVTTPLTLRPADPAGRITAAVGSLWVASDETGVVSRIDPETNEVVGEVFLARRPVAVAGGDDGLWVTSVTGDAVTRVNPYTNAVTATAKAGAQPGRLAVGEEGVWILNRGDGSVSRLDPKTNKIVATIAVAGAGNGEIATGAGSVWVSAPGLPLVRIDPVANRVAQRFTGDGGGAVLVAHGSVWVAAGPALTWRLDPVFIAAMRPE